MLPRLTPEKTLEPAYQAFLNALRNTDYSGDIDASYSGRLIAATDNSVYQSLPQAVLYPRTQEDVGHIMTLAAQPQHSGVRFSARGGGTGTNGQSLTAWLVIDLSRHLTRIVEINPEQGWVRVEAGIVKDALNQALAPYGFFFAPDTSTSNRCTIGGMINTDASGQGSLVYGKTSDHILQLCSYLIHGKRLTTQPVPLPQARELASLDTVEGQLYQTALHACVEHRTEIDARFPPLNRFLTGYDLKHTYSPEHEHIDLSRLIAGSEGSLAVVTEAKLSITRIPAHKTLVNIMYDNFQSALRHAPELVAAEATSVETIDSKVLNLAREDIIWHQVRDLLDNGKMLMDGINMVEFTARSAYGLQQKVDALCQHLDSDDARNKGVTGYRICDDSASIGRIYAMRKKAVGLLGATKGKRKPIAFVEDTAVPPQHLADFIHEFRQLLDGYGLHYGMFGHVDAGVLHVRPALDMQNPDDEALVRTVSDKVVALTAKYGGLMWGEHGKGYRSEYGPEFFGDALFTLLRKIKAVFDPHNRMNPGKICTPYGDEQSRLVSVDDRKRGWFDRQIPANTQVAYQTAMDCNGNGLCFNFEQTTPMCPSYRVSGDRRYSPKGRASLIREWLRLQHEAGYDPAQPAGQSHCWKKRKAKISDDDFNHQVKDSMDECLACKACSSQCPVKVDIPAHRSAFLAHYHSRYRRPLNDYLVRDIECWLPRMARMPRLVNTLNQSAITQKALRRWFGYTDVPALSVPPLHQRPLLQSTLAWDDFVDRQGQTPLDEQTQKRTVGLVQDPFTTFYEAELVEDFIRLCHQLSVDVVLLPYLPNGKAAHVKGFTETFVRRAQAQASILNQAASLNLPLVGLDASTALCFDDEYRQALGSQRGDFQVHLVHEWLHEYVGVETLHQQLTGQKQGELSLTLLLHCTEQTARPSSAAMWSAIFAATGVQATTQPTGCCGMAGTYGHETTHQNNSKALYAMSWQPVIEGNSEQTLLSSGFSCRCQAKRLSQVKLRHPLQQLVSILKQ